jgi:hypothetical protein
MLRLAFLLGLGIAGCDGGLGPSGGSDAVDYFPLAVGARWTYKNVDAAGVETTLVKEIDRCEEVAFVDCDSGLDRDETTYVQVTTGGGADPDEANTLYLEETEDGIVRVKQDFIQADVLDHYVTYSPYFMRLFNGPYGDDRVETYDHERCEYDVAGVDPPTQTHRSYLHRVLGHEGVTVPAGSYDALVIERIDQSDADTKRYYWAPGVGKVKEEAVGSTEVEELVEFAPGDGSCD